MPTLLRSSPVPGDVAMSLADLGVDIQKVQRDEAWACCPFHQESRPSWSVNLETGQYNCFGCGASGSFLRLVQHLEKVDPDRAREWIRDHGGFDAAKRKFRGETAYSKRQAVPVTNADLALFSDPPEWALKERDITLWAAQEFGVRYIPNEDRWVFPIRDPHTGRLRGWQEKSKRVFLNKPDDVEKRDTLFGIDVFEGETAIIVESPLDAVHLWSYWWDGALASFGVEVSDEQIRLVTEISRESVWALDNDRAGDRISAKIKAAHLGRHRIKFFNYGDSPDKDPGTMSPSALTWGIENAVPAYLARF